MNNTGIILLAAGASTRLGQPKQQLLYRGKTLLHHALTAARESGNKLIIMVAGAQPEILPAGGDSGIIVVQNPDWEEGMGTSIRCGLAAILKIYPGLAGVMFLVCDQPFVTGELLRQLVARKVASQKNIIACSYQNTLGTPVLFDKVYFPELLALNGQQGAKKLVYQYPEAVAAVDFPLGYIDIDTPADYAALQQKDKFRSERNS